jgi:excisionase family DNA binding protein
MNTDKPELLTAKEVARIFRVTPSAVLRWTRTGRIPAITTPGGRYLYNAATVHDLAHNTTHN